VGGGEAVNSDMLDSDGQRAMGMVAIVEKA
jgi:hypothetical protein